jgi:hypothetical protein
MLNDRLIRVYVLDRKGRAIPNATVKISVNGKFVATATKGSDPSGTVYTVQLSDPAAVVTLQAEYGTEAPITATLSQATDEWRFVFKNVEIPVQREQPFWEEHFAGLLGVAFIVLLFVTVLFLKEPSPLQYRVLIGILAVGLAGVGTELKV